MKATPKKLTPRLLISALGVLLIGSGIYLDRSGGLGQGRADPIAVLSLVFLLGIVMEFLAFFVERNRPWSDGEIGMLLLAGILIAGFLLGLF